MGFILSVIQIIMKYSLLGNIFIFQFDALESTKHFERSN